MTRQAIKLLTLGCLVFALVGFVPGFSGTWRISVAGNPASALEALEHSVQAHGGVLTSDAGSHKRWFSVSSASCGCASGGNQSFTIEIYSVAPHEIAAAIYCPTAGGCSRTRTAYQEVECSLVELVKAASTNSGIQMRLETDHGKPSS